MRLAIFVLLFSALLEYTRGEDSLIFTGSFYDSADCFRFSIDLENPKASIEWDGHSQNGTDRELGIKNRISKSIVCDEEESKMLRQLVQNFALCHSGPNVALGTGLSVRSTRLIGGKEKYSYSYFSLSSFGSSWKYVGKRGENLPLLFQSLITDDEFSSSDRIVFFKEVELFGKYLVSYQDGLNLLAECHANKSVVPWEKVLGFLAYTGQRQSWHLDLENWAVTESEKIISAILSGPGLGDYFPRKVPFRILVVTDEIFVESLDDGIAFTFSPPNDFGDIENEWVGFPPPVLGFIEDFLYDGSQLKDGNSTQIQHPYFDVRVGGNQEEKERTRDRLQFISESGLERHLLRYSPQEPPDIGVLRISLIDLNKKEKRCSVLIPGIEKCYTLLEKEHTQWTVLRVVNETSFQDNGFKEPLFK